MGTNGDTAGLRTQASALDTAAQALGQANDQLSRKVNGLVPDHFKAKAADALTARWGAHSEQAVLLGQAHTYVARVLRTLADDLDAADQPPGGPASRFANPGQDQRTQQQAVQRALDAARNALRGVRIPVFGPGMTVTPVATGPQKLSLAAAPAAAAGTAFAIGLGGRAANTAAGGSIAAAGADGGDVLLGAGEVAAGAVGEIVGGAADATGAGALVGVPEGVAAAGLIAAGVAAIASKDQGGQSETGPGTTTSDPGTTTRRDMEMGNPAIQGTQMNMAKDKGGDQSKGKGESDEEFFNRVWGGPPAKGAYEGSPADRTEIDRRLNPDEDPTDPPSGAR